MPTGRPTVGRLDLSHAYQRSLAALLPGRVRNAEAMGWFLIGPDGRSRRSSISGPEGGWLAASAPIAALTAALTGEDSPST